MPLKFRITSQMEGNIIPSTKSSFPLIAISMVDRGIRQM